MKAIALGWAKRKFIFPIIIAIKQGITVRSLSVSLALGFTIGIIPIYGIATFLVGFIALSLRLNFIAMQVAHYIVTPFQLVLIVPFFKVGRFLLKSHHAGTSIQEQLQLCRVDFWEGLRNLFRMNMAAVIIWLIVSIPLCLGLYYGFAWLIRRYIITRLHHVSV
jgi:uncharacterized protein (DUF2062 family)